MIGLFYWEEDNMIPGEIQVFVDLCDMVANYFATLGIGDASTISLVLL